MGEVIFELEKVFFSYMGRYPALCGIDLRVEQGKKIGIIGANGSGKSTLLHLLDGLIFPDKGIIKAFGRELREDAFGDLLFSRKFRKRVGLVFQNPDIQLFCPTVKEDIIFGPLQLGVERREIDRRFENLIEILGLRDLVNRSPHQLSVGEKRRVALASVLAIDPEVLILDEPTAGLDPLTARHLIDIILEANTAGKTIITATHDLHIIEEITDVVFVLNRDKSIAACLSPCELMSDTRLLCENNLIHIHSHRHGDKAHTHPHRHLEHHPEDR